MSAPRLLHRFSRTGCALFAAALVVLSAGRSRADVSSWFYVGGGAASTSFAGSTSGAQGTLALELGVGSAPDKAVIVGGLLKTLTYFGDGTDLALVVRGASGGFVRGDFGVALDLGAYQRFWQAESTGFLGALVLGAPFGIQLSLLTELGSNDARVFGATAGIDLLRLTVYRTSSQTYWPNPFPPGHLDGGKR